MLRPNASLTATLALLAFPTQVPAQTSQPLDRIASPQQSARNANYSIAVQLNPEDKTLTGRQILEWRNIQDQSTDELWFHLYWNAWRNNLSTWMREDRIRERSDRKGEIAEADWGWIEIETMTLLPRGGEPGQDLTSTLRFEAPDDGNDDDRTVVVALLTEPVTPGSTIEVEIVWKAKIPRTFARTGYRGDFYFIAHWFPKLGVFEGSSWNCHQYHASTEYFSDYGVYDVSITVPEAYVVGATGPLVESERNSPGTVTYRHVQEDVHAFTWTTSPDYVVLTDRFESVDLPSVDLRLLIQPEHLSQAARHFHATKVALDRYGRWYGPYPYQQLTVVDPAWGSGAGGMEYPTLFTAGTRLFNPFGGGSPEGVTIHEAGHQFWYGMVGNNEFEDAWLDEGLNTFSTARAFHDEYGDRLSVYRFFSPPQTEIRGFFPFRLKGFDYGRSIHGGRVDSYRSNATIDRQDTPSFRYYPAASGSLSYSKTALWLGTLERFLGWNRLQPAMSEFFRQNVFAHPEPDDFFRTLSESTDTDLDWFFDQVFRSSERFDYGIKSAVSYELKPDGMFKRGDGLVYGSPRESRKSSMDSEEQARVFRTEVVVRRYGSGIFPVDVLLVFEDGESIRYPWKGQERWRLIVEDRPAKLEYAAVDPDEVLLLDLRRINNSRTLKSRATQPALKWASRWMIWFQDLISTMAFYG